MVVVVVVVVIMVVVVWGTKMLRGLLLQTGVLTQGGSSLPQGNMEPLPVSEFLSIQAN